jgi:hypothetical protein
MKTQNTHCWIVLVLALAWGGGRGAQAADVAGYSVLKGHFLLQTGPGTPTTDPDLPYVILATVDLTEPDVVTNATLRTPGGVTSVMDDLSDSWDFLDIRDTLSQLNSA